jgi:hypothetical protein
MLIKYTSILSNLTDNDSTVVMDVSVIKGVVDKGYIIFFKRIRSLQLADNTG